MNFEDIFSSNLDPEQRARLRKIAGSVDRKQRLAVVASMATDPGLNRAGNMMLQDVENDRTQFAQRFKDEIDAANDLRKTLLDAEKDAENRAFRDRQQSDLQEYRRQLLGLQAARHASANQNAANRAATADARQQAALDAKAEAARARELATLSQRAQAAGLPEMHSAVGTFNQYMEQYPEGTDIPGFGGGANFIAKTPLSGMMSPEGRDLRSAFSAVENALIKSRAGSAVTQSEEFRTLRELASNAGASDDDFRKAWGRFNTRFGAVTQGVLSGFSPETQAEYRRRNAWDGSVQSGTSQTQGRDRGAY